MKLFTFNYHNSVLPKWSTGIYTDLHQRHGSKAWFFEIALLGYSIGICV